MPLTVEHCRELIAAIQRLLAQSGAPERGVVQTLANQQRQAHETVNAQLIRLRDWTVGGERERVVEHLATRDNGVALAEALSCADDVAWRKVLRDVRVLPPPELLTALAASFSPTPRPPAPRPVAQPATSSSTMEIPTAVVAGPANSWGWIRWPLLSLATCAVLLMLLAPLAWLLRSSGAARAPAETAASATASPETATPLSAKHAAVVAQFESPTPATDAALIQELEQAQQALVTALAALDPTAAQAQAQALDLHAFEVRQALSAPEDVAARTKLTSEWQALQTATVPQTLVAAATARQTTLAALQARVSAIDAQQTARARLLDVALRAQQDVSSSPGDTALQTIVTRLRELMSAQRKEQDALQVASATAATTLTTADAQLAAASTQAQAYAAQFAACQAAHQKLNAPSPATTPAPSIAVTELAAHVDVKAPQASSLGGHDSGWQRAVSLGPITATVEPAKLSLHPLSDDPALVKFVVGKPLAATAARGVAWPVQVVSKTSTAATNPVIAKFYIEKDVLWFAWDQAVERHDPARFGHFPAQALCVRLGPARHCVALMPPLVEAPLGLVHEGKAVRLARQIPPAHMATAGDSRFALPVALPSKARLAVDKVSGLLDLPTQTNTGAAEEPGGIAIMVGDEERLRLRVWCEQQQLRSALEMWSGRVVPGQGVLQQWDAIDKTKLARRRREAGDVLSDKDILRLRQRMTALESQLELATEQLAFASSSNDRLLLRRRQQALRTEMENITAAVGGGASAAGDESLDLLRQLESGWSELLNETHVHLRVVCDVTIATNEAPHPLTLYQAGDGPPSAAP